MRIIFIEADNCLDSDQEKFKKKLESNGYIVDVVTGCYEKENLSRLQQLLKDNVYNDIFVQTTFTYDKKFEAFLPLYKLINYPIEIWYTGHSSASRLRNYIPEESINNFTFYDVWTFAYNDGWEEKEWKKKV